MSYEKEKCCAEESWAMIKVRTMDGKEEYVLEPEDPDYPRICHHGALRVHLDDNGRIECGYCGMTLTREEALKIR